MKKNIFLLLASVSALSLNAQKIVIKGSDTVLPLSQKEAETYMKSHPNTSLSVIGGGSGVGIAALIDGTTDITMASRSLKMDEKLKIQDAGKSYKEVRIADDALAVVVNPANPVKKLTREQLEDIFTGKITNWKEVGGEDMKIVAYSRESSSGTYEFFKEHVLNKKNYSPTCLNMPATGAIIQSVSQTKGAIGYVGLAYLDKAVADVAVSYDKGKTYIQASYENAKNKTYPIVRPLFYYYNPKSESLVKPFIDYVLSAEGQKVVKDVGYIDIK
jgi:phosphate transport system substrate-binding protein